MKFLKNTHSLTVIDNVIATVLLALCIFLPTKLAPLRWGALVLFLCLFPVFVYVRKDKSKIELFSQGGAYIIICCVMALRILNVDFPWLSQKKLLAVVVILLIIAAAPSIRKPSVKGANN